MIRPPTQLPQNITTDQNKQNLNPALMRPPPNLTNLSSQMSSMTLNNTQQPTTNTFPNQNMLPQVPLAQNSYQNNDFINQNQNNDVLNQQIPPPNHFQPLKPPQNDQQMLNGRQPLTNNGPTIDNLPHMPPKQQLPNQFNQQPPNVYPPMQTMNYTSQNQMYPPNQQQLPNQQFTQQQQQQPPQFTNQYNQVQQPSQLTNPYLSGPPLMNQPLPRPQTPTQFNNQPGFAQQPPPSMGQPHYQQNNIRPPIGGMRPQFPNQTQPMSQQYPPQQPPMPTSQPQPQLQSQSRIDPDAIPNPIDVMQTNSSKQGGTVYRTSDIGQLPPLTTTDFIVKDEGNCNPRFIRSTMYSVPSTQELIKQSKVPMALCITPFAKLRVPDEMEPPVSNLGEMNPIRCKRCKAYMSPCMQFIENGRRFLCPYCDDTSEVPQEYFNHLDHMGKRVDQFERPELCLGSYEYTAGKDYCRNQQLPNPPVFIFMIDVSAYSIRTGLLNLICSKIKTEILPYLPKEHGQLESDIRIGFVTYDRELHFYNLKPTLAAPQMMVVSDLEEIFVPIMNGFLVKPAEAINLIDLLVEQLPQLFVDNKETDLILGPVIEAGIEAIIQAKSPGKLFIFHSNLPSAAGTHGQLKNRDDKKHLGTDKEKQVFAPQNDYYSQLGKKCIEAGCAVDLFLISNQFVDLATISEVTRRCGGKIYKYDFFNASTHGDRLINDLKINIENSIAFDAVMKVRTSTGLRAVDHLGNFNVTGTNDVEFGAINRDTSISVEIKHDDKLNENLKVYIQAAILFTSVSGQRRIRIHNLILNICDQYANLYQTLELDTIINYMAKLACRSVLVSTPKSIGENIMQQTASILACYRKYCASTTSRGQFILPETLKLMPLFINSLLKCDAISGVKMVTVDERAWQMYKIMSMDVSSSFNYLYPRLLSLVSLFKKIKNF